MSEPPSPTPQQEAAFETKIRPLLAANCYPCHGSTQQSGGLRLDSLAAMLKGGASGPSLVPGDPDKSAIVRAVRYDGKLKMPPTGKLRPEEIQAFTAWVKAGAPWPEPKHAGGVIISATGITPEQRQFWSFQPVHKPALPAVKRATWVKSPIDRFILAKLEAKGLKPAPPADRRSLIRRAYFDLIGLPPTPEQIDAFINDKSPDAFAKVVDSLLASPHYGERWGRHWLDVARYADSNGLDENLSFGNAWRYRDYVVDSFNHDKPYDVFIREQLAGDLMQTDDEKLRNERMTATAFLSMGPKVLAEPDKPKLAMDIVDEQIEVTSKAFLGLTVACARCHNHKFDPIPTKDYYALAGIFKSTRTMQDLGGVARVLERPLMTAELETQIKAYEQKLAAVQDTQNKVTGPANAAVLADLKANGEKYLQAGWELSRQPELKSVAERPLKPGERRMIIEAENFNRGNVIRDFTTYGKGIGVIINETPPDFAEWDITVPAAGPYQVEFRYASNEERPVRLLLNGKLVNASTAGQNTGSFQPDGQRWEVQGVYVFHAGLNTLRMEADNVIPHFDKLLVEPLADAAGSPGQAPPKTAEEIAAVYGVKTDLVRYFAERLHDVKDMDAARKMLTTAKDGLLALPDKPERFYPDDTRMAATKAQHNVEMVKASEPKKPMALAVEDGKIENVRVHIRGSTENLGDLEA
jgi:cytochrome c553